MAEWALLRRLFGFVEESGKGVIKTALKRSDRRIFVDETRGKRFVTFGERLQGGGDVRIGDGGLTSTVFRDGESDGGKRLFVDAHEIGSEAHIEQRSVRRELARLAVFVAVRGKKIGAIGRAIERDFALSAATDGADFFRFGRAEALGFAFLTNWTGHEIP